MNERIKEIRKYFDVTQEEFSKKINISRANLANIETGRISVIDRVVADVCREYNISEEWLRTGNGNMFEDFLDIKDTMTKIGRIYSNGKPFQKRFIDFMASQPDENWDALEKLIDDFNDFYNKIKK